MSNFSSSNQVVQSNELPTNLWVVILVFLGLIPADTAKIITDVDGF